MMSHNVGLLDRILRLALAGVLLFLGLDTYSGSTTGIILSVASIVPTLTAILGTCPVYSILGLRTCRMQ
jgi:uncharacterized membrane protein YgdD (TMEM256/DUF423 family)